MCKFLLSAPCFCFLPFLPVFWHGTVQDIGKTGPKSESLLCYVNCFLPTVWCHQSRASDDSVWVHDKAPGATRAATQLSNPSASLSNKLMVTNLHYEITPKDLTVCPDAFASLPCHDFAPSGGNFWANWHARARAIHQGTKIRLPLPRVVIEENTFNLLAPPFPDSVMLTRLRFTPFFTLSFCICFRTLV
jgi:hypothetical protein